LHKKFSFLFRSFSYFNIVNFFSKVYFNLNERNLYATDGFDMKYGEIGLKGRDIVLNEADQSFKVTGDVKFTYQDYVFDVNYIEKLGK